MQILRIVWLEVCAPPHLLEVACLLYYSVSFEKGGCFFTWPTFGIAIVSCFSFSFFFASPPSPQHMEFPSQGSDLSHSCNPSQSCRNTGSLIHYWGLGIKPASYHSQDAFALQSEILIVRLMGANSCFLVVWICISLMTNIMEHFVIYFFNHQISSPMN